MTSSTRCGCETTWLHKGSAATRSDHGARETAPKRSGVQCLVCHSKCCKRNLLGILLMTRKANASSLAARTLWRLTWAMLLLRLLVAMTAIRCRENRAKENKQEIPVCEQIHLTRDFFSCTLHTHCMAQDEPLNVSVCEFHSIFMSSMMCV